MIKKRTVYIAVPLCSKIVILGIISSILLTFAGASNTKDLVSGEFREDYTAFITAFETIKKYAPEELEHKDIIFNAVRGMLATLDPHTHFLDTDAFSYMREEQEGSFFGIGISFDISKDDYIRVVAPIEGTPAYKLGIRAGDKIVKIDGESTKNITEVEVIAKLRGEKGSSVVVTIEREGETKLRDITIIRDKIPLFTVRKPYMLTDDIGYIKVTQFSKPTKKEVLKGLEELHSMGMKKLVLDLRANPGGLLDQAVELSDLFVEKGNNIVMTGGRVEDSNWEFKARTDEKYRDLPIIILVNGFSASASEIVAGALQDLDRALIVGSRTYGKGLVQRQWPLEPYDLGTAIQITTAKYYTPSKRCIQRSYETPHERFFSKNAQNPENESTEPSYFSKGGRKLDGGGGIVPDVEIKVNIPAIVGKLFLKEVFFNFAINYSKNHETVPLEFKVEDTLFDEFKKYAEDYEVETEEEEWTDNREKIKQWIKREIISAYFGLEEKLKVINENDEQLQEALKLFDQAEDLLTRFKSSGTAQAGTQQENSKPGPLDR